MSAHTDSRFTLRDLPLPAKLVVTCFLLAVGIGYGSAMVQLHFQDSKSGKPMPTVEDVILKFTGKKWFTDAPPRPLSKFVKLLVTPPGAPFNGSGTMAPAFTSRDGGEFSRKLRESPNEKDKLQQERDGERDALVLWAESEPETRSKTFADDRFALPEGKAPKAITAEFLNSDGMLKVKSLIEARCTRCHMKDGDDAKAETFPLQTMAQIEKYLDAPAAAPFRQGGDWVRVEEPMSLEKLTQSTHAHLLSFAVLFSLTGLVFAFTSYPTVVRCLISPLVLIAIVTDVAFWWLARLSENYGMYFAMGVIGTGGVAGLGLATQIGLSLWNIYGWKGKMVLLALFVVAGVAGGMVANTVILPGLDAKQGEIAKLVDTTEKKAPDEKAKKDEQPLAKKEEPKKVDPKQPDPTPASMLESDFARALHFPVMGPDGKELAITAIPFDKGDKKNMVRAFFDKDGADYNSMMRDTDLSADEKKQLTEERHGELAATRAWLALPDAERRKAFEADAFALPPTLAKKPVSADYSKNGKVLIKTLIVDRCVRCHADEENVPFDEDYGSLLPYLTPKPVEK